MLNDATSWNRKTACGYLVVRKPNQNFDKSGQATFNLAAPCLGNLYYAGVDRMEWFEIDEFYYTNQLPPSIKKLRELLKQENRDFTGFLLSKNIEQTKELLSFSNNLESTNEAIVVYSTVIVQVKGEIEVDARAIEWLGFDVVSLGNWSLIEAGVFRKPKSFESWIDRLNQNGLFTNEVDAKEYIESYQTLASLGVVEELPESSYGIDLIEVGAMQNL